MFYTYAAVVRGAAVRLGLLRRRTLVNLSPFALVFEALSKMAVRASRVRMIRSEFLVEPRHRLTKHRIDAKRSEKLDSIQSAQRDCAEKDAEVGAPGRDVVYDEHETASSGKEQLSSRDTRCCGRAGVG